MIDAKVQFPLTVTFEDGSKQDYQDIADIELNLEDFDSTKNPDCSVRDSSGKPVRLIVTLLRLEELEVIQVG